MEQEKESIMLIDDEGKEYEFEHLMTLDIRENRYVVLSPMEDFEDMDEDEVIILKVEKDENENDIYLGIEDDDEAEQVFEAFEEVYEAQI